MSATTSRGDSFRTKSLPERLAEALPSGGALGSLRQRLKPLFNRWLARHDDGFRSVLPGGEVVLVSPAFRHITWNREEYNAFRAAVTTGATIIEAGSNVGAYTVLFGQWVGPGGQVFAFEPDPTAFEGLRRHVEINHIGDRVTPVAAAISDGSQKSLRLVLGESSGISRMAHDADGAVSNVAEVPALSIDAFCAEHRLRPSVIKIDVEGAELAALRGARQAITAAGSRLQLFVEMHPALWPALGYAAEDVERECRAQGLTVEHLDGSQQGVWTTEGVCLRLRPKSA
jgi:FkbM family methyltransferase